MINRRTILLICISVFVSSMLLSNYTMMSTSGTEETVEPHYVEIADYYDNREAVVTVTADDWIGYTGQKFEEMSRMLTEKRIYYTGAIITDLANWTQIQYWLNQGYAEAASHSRTHPSTVPYGNYDSEIGGSKQDILNNLILPAHFSNGNSEYVYTWIEPYGTSDSIIRQKLGQYNYLVDRRVGIDDGWATWDSANGLFGRIGFSIRMESGYVTDAATSNSRFDSVYSSGQIYHLFFHPQDANWEPGQYADLHTSYISNRNDVWYVNFGLLYLYHWIDAQNVVQVTSIGSLQDKVFKVTIPSTDHQNYGVKYPLTYVFDIPTSWTNGYVNYRFQETDPWTTMKTKTSSDFFNGIDAVRFDFENHKAYVSIGFDDSSNDINLQILPQDSEPVANYSGSPISGLEPLTVNFTDGSISYDGIISWEWSFGDGETSIEQNPIHTYSQDGDYFATLTVIDADGSTNSTTNTIVVTDKDPIPSFNASLTNGTEPLQVNFEDASKSYDGIVEWTWDFGDGNSSTGQNATHIYASDGIYTVTLSVVEGDGDNVVKIEEAYIRVNDTTPSANFTTSQTSAVLTVSFIDTSTSYDEIASWFWDFGDGQTSTEKNPTHKFPDDGTFNASLTVMDEDGSKDTTTKEVLIVNVAPTPDFNIISSQKPTTDEDIMFSDQSSDPDGDIVSWFWDLGDGTNSATQNVTHRYFVLGTFIVNLTVTDDDGQTGTISRSVTIYDEVPPVTIDDYDNLVHTSDFTITLTAIDDVSGVAQIYYRINGDPIQNVGANGQPLITTEGANNQLEYWSVDNAGNEEPHHILEEIKLDKTSLVRAIWILGGIILAIGMSALGIMFYVRTKKR